MRHPFTLFAVLVLLSAAPAAARPNVVVVLIDDMGWSDLSCFGNTEAKTPNIDKLAEEGIRFRQFYVAAPICSPSRTGIITGQYPGRWKITSFLAERKSNETRGLAQWLDLKAPSLPRMLQQSGYATGHFGKWHIGGQRDVGEAPLVAEYGFDAALTQFEGLGDRILPIQDRYDGKAPIKNPLGLGSEKLGRGKITWMDRSQITSAFVGRAIEFMQQAEKDGKPFFVNVWPDDVHSPFFPPKELRDDKSKRNMYLGVLRTMDAQLGPLFEHIRSNPKLRDNTLILLCSDNGPEDGAGSAGPYRGSKGNLYEGGIRSPLIAWGPGVLAGELRGKWDEKNVIVGIDLAPSLLSLTSAKPPAEVRFDGQDMSAALLGKAQVARTAPLFWLRPPDRPGKAKERWPDLAVRDGDLKLLVMRDGTQPELFDLSADSGEKNNLAEKRPEDAKRLTKLAQDWAATMR